MLFEFAQVNSCTKMFRWSGDTDKYPEDYGLQIKRVKFFVNTEV